ncbi:hypothetical protein [Phenylobacterium sp.]|jgi:hypothetical protein|uniref:hypothetical protein n=1 Tax=Phenylobacterium sp. TaxID=1871053 RepID=UPI002E381784|nr:hypothetical protein [Phenylobacterium sp.]HEX2562177.1 hypothetical protein [Phenylobacterium sp.]
MDWPPTDTHTRALVHLEEDLRAACLVRCMADHQRAAAGLAKAYADARIETLTRHIAEVEAHRPKEPVRITAAPERWTASGAA